MTVGERLKEERLRLGMSQARLAAVAGVSKNTAINWERGASSPTIASLIATAEAGVDLTYVVTGRREQPVVQSLIDDEVNAIRRDLLDARERRLPGETEQEADQRIIEKSKNQLAAILRYDRPLITAEQAELVSDLLKIATDPAKLKQYRALDFSENRSKRESAKADILEYLEGAPYVPSGIVAGMLVRLTLDYGVPVKFIAEIIWEVAVELAYDDAGMKVKKSD